MKTEGKVEGIERKVEKQETEKSEGLNKEGRKFRRR